jgi:SAM-dependent methyltransferase
MLNRIRDVVRQQAYRPDWLGIGLNPFYLARRGLYRVMSDLACRMHGALLDVGCGSKPYQALFSVSSYVGLDIDSEQARHKGVADAFYDGHRFPFEACHFDSVLCNQVLEHVFNPDEFLSEIHRVLVPGGMLLLTVPFVWDEHEQPFDYARYSSFGLAALLERHGFRIKEHRKIGADASIFFQLFNAYLYKITLKSPRWFSRVVMLTAAPIVTLLGLFWGKLLPDNPDLYLDQVVLAEKTL